MHIIPISPESFYNQLENKDEVSRIEKGEATIVNLKCPTEGSSAVIELASGGFYQTAQFNSVA